MPPDHHVAPITLGETKATWGRRRGELRPMHGWERVTLAKLQQDHFSCHSTADADSTAVNDKTRNSLPQKDRTMTHQIIIFAFSAILTSIALGGCIVGEPDADSQELSNVFIRIDSNGIELVGDEFATSSSAISLLDEGGNELLSYVATDDGQASKAADICWRCPDCEPDGQGGQNCTGCKQITCP